MTLVLKNLTKQYGSKTVVNDLSFEVKEGSVFGFIGENGAGKSTTFRMILNIISSSSGQILWKGSSSIDSNRIGYLPEERGLFPKKEVFSQLLYLAKLKGLSKAEATKNVHYLLHKFKMEEYKNKKLEELSKGNQQKIQLLAAIAHEPDLLILDEPFTGLDPLNTEFLKSTIKELKQKGTTIIFSSHRMENVEELCDEICILKNGEIICQGNLNKLLNAVKEKKVVIKSILQPEDLKKLRSLPGVLSVKTIEKNVFELTIENENEMSNILTFLVNNNVPVIEFYLNKISLHEFFVKKVGKANEKE